MGSPNSGKWGSGPGSPQRPGCRQGRGSPGGGGRRGAARSPLPSLCTPSPPSPPLVSLPTPRPPPPCTAELQRSPPSRAASGGGAKSRLFPAPAEQSPRPVAERTRRGGKRACGRRARVGPGGEERAEASPCAVRYAAAAGAGRASIPTRPLARALARTREPVGEVDGAVLGSRSFLGPGTTQHCACAQPWPRVHFGVDPKPRL